MPLPITALACTQHLIVREKYRIIHTKYSLLLLFSFLALQLSFASALASSQKKDTIPAKAKSYKLNREQFYKAYGRDDSARALIGYYFYERNNAKRVALAGIIVAVLTAAIGSFLIANSPTQQPGTVEDYGDLGILVFFGLGFYGSLALIITGSVRWAIFSRKKLYRLLENYYSGKSIPSHIRRSRIYHQWFIKEKKGDLHQ